MKQYKVIREPRVTKVQDQFEWRRGWLFFLPAWEEFRTKSDTWKVTRPSVNEVLSYNHSQAFHLHSQNGERVEITFAKGLHFDGALVWKGRSWRLLQLGAFSVLEDDEGTEAARVSEAWKDADQAAGISHWLETSEDLDPFLAALAVGLAIGGIYPVDSS